MLGGSPYVEGSRVPVRRLFAFYRSGASVETLLRRYPSLGPAKILDALAFAFDNEEVIDADLDREAALMTQAGVQNRGPRDSRQIELPFAAEDDPMPARGSAGPRRRRGT